MKTLFSVLALALCLGYLAILIYEQYQKNTTNVNNDANTDTDSTVPRNNEKGNKE